MDDTRLQQFRQLISARTGLCIRNQDSEALRKKIALRLKVRRLSKAEEYYQLLETDTVESQREWQELTLLLTTGESYFFRDQGQFTLLQSRILPELIERRRTQRSLRLWSAGCSSGEEPYSLAVLVDELIPQRDEWNILILGTDINNAAIDKAKQGVYGPWSFRTVKPDLQRRYFHQRKNDWELDERIRQMVRFRPGNLLRDPFPGYTSDLHDLDLILCRNVFIYFDRSAVSAVIGKFAATLSPGGYLMTGHAELYGQNLGCLQARLFSESVVYQRCEPTPLATSAAALETPAVLAPIVCQDPLLPEPAVASERIHPVAGATPAIEGSPRHLPSLYLMAQAYANSGEYDQAARCCRQALEVDAFAVAPYYLLAEVAQEQGDSEEAKNLLKKIIYLCPSFVAAYLDLGALYERENEALRARKMWGTALQLLQALPPQATVEPYGGTTAEELALYVQRLTNQESKVEG